MLISYPATLLKLIVLTDLILKSHRLPALNLNLHENLLPPPWCWVYARRTLSHTPVLAFTFVVPLTFPPGSLCMKSWAVLVFSGVGIHQPTLAQYHADGFMLCANFTEFSIRLHLLRTNPAKGSRNAALRVTTELLC